MSTVVANLVNQHKPLIVGLLQISHDLTHGSENRAHREREAVHPTALATSRLLAIANVVQPAITDRAAFFGVVELLAVVGEDGVKATTCRVREEAPILLALPMKIVNVHNIVTSQDSQERGKQGLRDVLV